LFREHTGSISSRHRNVTVDGTVLDTWFPAPELGTFDGAGTVRIEGGDIPSDLALLAEARELDQVVVRTVSLPTVLARTVFDRSVPSKAVPCP
jgi:hypothetical protein